MADRAVKPKTRIGAILKLVRMRDVYLNRMRNNASPSHKAYSARFFIFYLAYLRNYDYIQYVLELTHDQPRQPLI